MRRLATLLVALLLCVPACAKGESQFADGAAAMAAGDAGDTQATDATDAAIDASAPRNNRIIIKTGYLSLVVMDAGEAMSRIDSLLKEYKAFEAGRESFADVSGREVLAASEVSNIILTLKVPAAQFESFLDAVKQVGSYTREQTNALDVTLKYVDLEARLASNKQVETRLQAHLASATNVKEIVEIEKELGRVREQIESLTAQFRVMQDQVAYSTLSVEISVRPDWIEPSQRSLWEDITQVLSQSLYALFNTGRVGLVYGLAMIPWLVIAGGMVYGLVALRRLRRRRRQARK